MQEMTLGQYNLVYNFFSFTIAAMGAATVFLWLNRSQVAERYRPAVTISGLVTFIALYHYVRITHSWEQAFSIMDGSISLSGKPFNDAYRYVDWLLTVPLLLVELILVMRLSKKETVSRSVKLGGLAALMVILGYPGENATDGTARTLFWVLSMIPFYLIVKDLYFGLKDSVDKQPEQARDLITAARYLVIGSWAFYPIVYLFPALGLNGGTAYTAVQVGYSIADVVAKAVFGVLIYTIAVRKSYAELEE